MVVGNLRPDCLGAISRPLIYLGMLRDIVTHFDTPVEINSTKACCKKASIKWTEHIFSAILEFEEGECVIHLSETHKLGSQSHHLQLWAAMFRRLNELFGRT